MKLHMRRTNKQSGFTLIELMITLVVGSILLVIAVPSFLSFQKDNRRVSQINELVSGLNLARSEAIKSNATVGFCPSSDGATCSGAIYDNGWIVFLNNDADSPPAVDAGETVLRVHTGTTTSGSSLRATGITTGLNYAATGRPSAPGDITYCDDRGVTKARRVIVSRVGLVTAASALSCP
jgi:type IV fimbrial biogenesis protein FimT